MKARFAIVLTVVALACGNPVDPDRVDPGFVTVSVASTNQGVGAMWLTISGSIVDSVRASGLTLYGASVSPSQHKAIVTGAISGGEVLRFWVPDRSDSTSYGVVLQEAASAGSYEQLATSGFTLTLVPATN